MIALGILFGQRAQTLERGNSSTSLIKSGSNQATIKVVINNNLNYKVDEYGDKIIIEKRLRAKEARLSIYNAYGKIFTIKKTELENIIERYGLKFDNPLNFLTQEKSKRFLNVTRPEDLYEFYYLGTEFKNIEEELLESSSILDNMNRKIEEVIREQENVESKLAIRRKDLQYLEFDPEAALRKLDKEEKWIGIQEAKRQIERLLVEIDECDEKIVKFELERKELDTITQATIKDENTNEIDELQSKLKVQAHDVSNELSGYFEDRDKLIKQLEKLKSKNNVAQLENELAELEADLSIKKEQLAQLENQKSEAFERSQREKEKNQEKEQRIYALRKQINYLRENAFDANKQEHFRRFKQVEDAIKRAPFKDVVIGPVCNYVKLKEYSWFKTVSMVLKKSLMNYLVFNSEDKSRLHGLFKQLNVNYPISQMSGKTPYSNLKTNRNFKLMLDVVQLDHPLVANHLITLNSIEQIILIEDRQKAYQAIKKNPPDVDCAYTQSGDKIKLQNGSLSDFRPRDDGVYWFEDKESRMKNLERELSGIEISEECRMEYQRLMHTIGRLSNEIEESEKKMMSLGIELESIRDLKENDTEGIEKKLRSVLKVIEVLDQKKKQLDFKVAEAEEAKRVIIGENRRKREELRKKKDEAFSRGHKMDFEQLLCEKRKIECIETRRSLQEKNEKDVEELEKLGEEPETVRSMQEVIKERKTVHEFKVKAKQMESKGKLERSIEKMASEVMHLTKLREKFEKTIRQTEEACHKREQKRDEIKGRDTKEAIRLFKEYTMKNGYVGEMVVDHSNRKLDLKMKVHNSSVSGSKSTLSGGERSFAGVCFLLSMWSCFKCPIKILDEFDVFMDSLNRQTAIRSLLGFFKENQTQVILITPLDTSDLNDSECDIKILMKQGS